MDKWIRRLKVVDSHGDNQVDISGFKHEIRDRAFVGFLQEQKRYTDRLLKQAKALEVNEELPLYRSIEKYNRRFTVALELGAMDCETRNFNMEEYRQAITAFYHEARNEAQQTSTTLKGFHAGKTEQTLNQDQLGFVNRLSRKANTALGEAEQLGTKSTHPNNYEEVTKLSQFLQSCLAIGKINYKSDKIPEVLGAINKAIEKLVDANKNNLSRRANRSDAPPPRVAGSSNHGDRLEWQLDQENLDIQEAIKQSLNEQEESPPRAITIEELLDESMECDLTEERLRSLKMLQRKVNDALNRRPNSTGCEKVNELSQFLELWLNTEKINCKPENISSLLGAINDTINEFDTVNRSNRLTAPDVPVGDFSFYTQLQRGRFDQSTSIQPWTIREQRSKSRLEEKRVNPELKLLVAGNENEINTVKKIVSLRALYDLWQNQHVTGQKKLVRPALEKPEIPGFDDIYAEAEKILNTNIGNLSPEQLANIDTYTETLRNGARAIADKIPAKTDKEDINVEDLQPIQLVLRDAIEETRAINSWTRKWTTDYARWFDNFTDPWVKTSLNERGIEPEKINKYYSEEFVDNKYVKEALVGADGGRPANRAAYDCSPDEVVERYKALTEANSKLSYCHSHLKEGILTPNRPREINGLRRVPNSGTGLNCLILSAMEVSGKFKDWSEKGKSTKAQKIREAMIKDKENRLKEVQKSIVEDLRERAKPSEENPLQTRGKITPDESALLAEENDLKEKIDEMKNGKMLDAGTFGGMELLAKQLVKEKLWKPNHVVLVYSDNEQDEDGFFRVQCTQSETGRPDETSPTYAFYLQRGVHYEAMIPKDQVQSIHI